MKRVLSGVNIRILIVSVCFGIINSLCTVYLFGILCGRSLYEYFDSGRTIIKYTMIIFSRAVLTAASLYVILWAISKKQGCINHNHGEKKVSFKIIWFITIVPFAVAYIAYWPGMTSYDAFAVISQAIGLTEKNDFQPYLYTWLFTILYKVEIATKIKLFAIVAMTSAQILLVSFSVARLFQMIMRYEGNFALIACFVFLYCFLPIHVMTLALTKDVMFGAFFVLFVLELSKLFDSKKVGLKLEIYGVLGCLLRHNFLYAIVVLAIFTIVLVRKHFDCYKTLL